MESILLYLPLVWYFLLLCEAAPWANYETTQRQACGDKLADIMSLVCSGRGYNVPFRPERSSGSRRFRRQIVDECCRRSCNPSMLELYCRADPTEAPKNTPIRKRSDSGYESTELQQMEEITQHSTEQAQVSAGTRSQNNIKENKENYIVKKPKHNFKILNLLDPSERISHKQKPKDNKSMQNDTMEEEIFKLNNFPSLRHRKHPHHSKQLRGHKSSGKTKRDQNISEESKQTFQIGTVKPYFAGRALVSYRTNHVRHAPPHGS